jgi:Uma2 family endonuclease
MAGAVHRKVASLSVAAFRAWSRSRPDEERWELIDGVPMMMAPPTRDHQRIASNLERLLNDALEMHRPALSAYQRVGLDLGAVAENYDPEPDVAVVDANADGDPRYTDRFYLAAEVVSDSDRDTVAAKCEIYKRHPHCGYVLVVQQDRCEVSVAVRSGDRWKDTVLTHPGAQLVLPEMHLLCAVAELYKGTVVQRSGGQEVGG